MHHLQTMLSHNGLPLNIIRSNGTQTTTVPHCIEMFFLSPAMFKCLLIQQIIQYIFNLTAYSTKVCNTIWQDHLYLSLSPTCRKLIYLYVLWLKDCTQTLSQNTSWDRGSLPLVTSQQNKAFSHRENQRHLNITVNMQPSVHWKLNNESVWNPSHYDRWSTVKMIWTSQWCAVPVQCPSL